jgi:CRP-like cAMP-binding protein
MVSLEIIRRYPFFAGLDEGLIKSIAMITELVHFSAGDILFKPETFNQAIYLLISGNIEYFLVIDYINDPNYYKEFYIDDINPGEVFGLSALIEPHSHSTLARASRSGTLLSINVPSFINLCDSDPRSGYQLMTQITKTAVERLQKTRVLLAAAQVIRPAQLQKLSV